MSVKEESQELSFVCLTSSVTDIKLVLHKCFMYPAVLLCVKLVRLRCPDVRSNISLDGCREGIF